MPSCCLAKPVLQPMQICLGSHSLVFRLTKELWFSLSIPPHLVIKNFFLRLFASLGGTFPQVVVKLLPWKSEISLSCRMFAMNPYLLTCTRPERVTIVSTLFETSWSPRLLQGRILPMCNCTKCVLLIIVVIELHSLPINRTSFHFILFFPVIPSVSQSA